jgi:hypothetical protein
MPLANHLIGDLQADLSNFNPINGLNSTPEVDIDEAIAATGVANVEGALFGAKLFAQANPHPQLTPKEVACVNLYSMDSPFYVELNKALASKNRAEAKKFFKVDVS